MWKALIGMSLILTIGSAHSETLTGSADAFNAPNVYSPSVSYDSQDSNFKMWYGGWQFAGQQRDSIYYRTSSNAVNDWSNPVEVLTASSISQRFNQLTGQVVNFRHVNDPSVTKHFNVVSGAYQYTMFFTACSEPCTQGSDNSIWSVVSADGVNWDYPQQVSISLPSGVSGPQNPSVIIDDNNPNNVVWHVYFSVSTDVGNNVYVVYVGGDRSSISNAYSAFNFYQAVQNPGVSIVGGTWYLFFNTSNAVGGYDIHYATASSNYWVNEAPLIVNNGSPFCAAVTPSATPITSARYLLYFSTIQTNAQGSCDFTQNTTMSIRDFTR